MSGRAAQDAVERGRRTTTSRRELGRHQRFDELSPDVGELDEQAFQAMYAEDPDVALALLADAVRATDRRLRELARLLAPQVIVDVARRGQQRSAGFGTLASLPYEPAVGDLDLDRSIGALAEHRQGRGLDVERLRVTGWRRPTTALCLLIDSSGSMGGRPLATGAVGAAAIALRAPQRYAVVSFSSSVLVLKAMGEPSSAERVVGDVLSLRGCGTTELAGALREGARQLRRDRASRRVTVLFSDCRATAPGDVMVAAAGLDELVVVAPHTDDAEARRLAAAVGAKVAAVAGPTDVPAVLTDLLG